MKSPKEVCKKNHNFTADSYDYIQALLFRIADCYWYFTDQYSTDALPDKFLSLLRF